MAKTLGALSEEDRSDFERRLNLRGLNTSDILQQTLDVQSPTYHLSHKATQHQRFNPHILKTANLDTLKQWLGVPNNVVRGLSATQQLVVPHRWTPRTAEIKKAMAAHPHGPLPASMKHVNVEHIHPDDLSVIHTLIRAYMYGDSARVERYRPLLEGYLVAIDLSILAWVFRTITVHAGCILQVDASPGILIAYEVILERGSLIADKGSLLGFKIIQGGRIECSGDFTLSATILRRA